MKFFKKFKQLSKDELDSILYDWHYNPHTSKAENLNKIILKHKKLFTSVPDSLLYRFVEDANIIKKENQLIISEGLTSSWSTSLNTLKYQHLPNAFTQNAKILEIYGRHKVYGIIIKQTIPSQEIIVDIGKELTQEIDEIIVIGKTRKVEQTDVLHEVEINREFKNDYIKFD